MANREHISPGSPFKEGRGSAGRKQTVDNQALLPGSKFDISFLLREKLQQYPSGLNPDQLTVLFTAVQKQKRVAAMGTDERTKKRLNAELLREVRQNPAFPQSASGQEGNGATSYDAVFADAKTPFDVIALSNLGLVLKYARSTVSKRESMTYQDLIHEGYIGLCTAIDKYDITQPKFDPYGKSGYMFSTVAMQWIRNSVNRSIDDQDRTVRIASGSLRGIYAANDVVNAYYNEHSKLPPVSYIAEHLQDAFEARAAKSGGRDSISQLTDQQKATAASIALGQRRVDSLDVPVHIQDINGGNEVLKRDTIIDSDGIEKGFDAAFTTEQAAALETALSQFSPRDRKMFFDHYLYEKKYAEIAAEHGLSKDRPKQIITRMCTVLGDDSILRGLWEDREELPEAQEDRVWSSVKAKDLDERIFGNVIKFHHPEIRPKEIGEAAMRINDLSPQERTLFVRGLIQRVQNGDGMREDIAEELIGKIDYSGLNGRQILRTIKEAAEQLSPSANPSRFFNIVETLAEVIPTNPHAVRDIQRGVSASVQRNAEVSEQWHDLREQIDAMGDVLRDAEQEKVRVSGRASVVETPEDPEDAPIAMPVLANPQIVMPEFLEDRVDEFFAWKNDEYGHPLDRDRETRNTVRRDVWRQLGTMTPNEQTDAAVKLVQGLGNSEWTVDQRDAALDILRFVDKADMSRVRAAMADAIETIEPDADPLGNVYSLLEGYDIVSKRFDEDPLGQGRIGLAMRRLPDKLSDEGGHEVVSYKAKSIAQELAVEEPEVVQMYHQGIPVIEIAAAKGTLERTVFKQLHAAENSGIYVDWRQTTSTARVTRRQEVIEGLRAGKTIAEIAHGLGITDEGEHRQLYRVRDRLVRAGVDLSPTEVAQEKAAIEQDERAAFREKVKSLWGDNTIAEIEEITGTKGTPAVRTALAQLRRTGEIGKKTPGPRSQQEEKRVVSDADIEKRYFGEDSPEPQTVILPKKGDIYQKYGVVPVEDTSLTKQYLPEIEE